MSREKKLHTLIEQQEPEEKKRVWGKLKTELELHENEDVIESSGEQAVLSIRSKRMILLLLFGFVSLFCIILCLILLLHHNEKNNIRYSSEGDYTLQSTDLTLAEYALQINKNLLYIDWYDDPEYIFSSLLKLNETGEVISFIENFIDIEKGCIVKLSVMENTNAIDSYNKYADICYNTISIASTQVNWGNLNNNSLAYFEYRRYVYYLEVLYSAESDGVLEYVEQLLQKK